MKERQKAKGARLKDKDLMLGTGCWATQLIKD